jgi:hypothetical protein
VAVTFDLINNLRFGSVANGGIRLQSVQPHLKDFNSKSIDKHGYYFDNTKLAFNNLENKRIEFYFYTKIVR